MFLTKASWLVSAFSCLYESLKKQEVGICLEETDQSLSVLRVILRAGHEDLGQQSIWNRLAPDCTHTVGHHLHPVCVCTDLWDVSGISAARGPVGHPGDPDSRAQSPQNLHRPCRRHHRSPSCPDHHCKKTITTTKYTCLRVQEARSQTDRKKSVNTLLDWMFWFSEHLLTTNILLLMLNISVSEQSCTALIYNELILY